MNAGGGGSNCFCTISRKNESLWQKHESLHMQRKWSQAWNIVFKKDRYYFISVSTRCVWACLWLRMYVCVCACVRVFVCACVLACKRVYLLGIRGKITLGREWKCVRVCVCVHSILKIYVLVSFLTWLNVMSHGYQQQLELRNLHLI